MAHRRARAPHARERAARGPRAGRELVWARRHARPRAPRSRAQPSGRRRTRAARAAGGDLPAGRRPGDGARVLEARARSAVEPRSARPARPRRRGARATARPRSTRSSGPASGAGQPAAGARGSATLYAAARSVGGGRRAAGRDAASVRGAPPAGRRAGRAARVPLRGRRWPSPTTTGAARQLRALAHEAPDFVPAWVSAGDRYGAGRAARGGPARLGCGACGIDRPPSCSNGSRRLDAAARRGAATGRLLRRLAERHPTDPRRRLHLARRLIAHGELDERPEPSPADSRVRGEPRAAAQRGRARRAPGRRAIAAAEAFATRPRSGAGACRPLVPATRAGPSAPDWAGGAPCCGRWDTLRAARRSRGRSPIRRSLIRRAKRSQATPPLIAATRRRYTRGQACMSQIFHRSTNTLSRVSIFGALFVVAGPALAAGRDQPLRLRDGPERGARRSRCSSATSTTWASSASTAATATPRSRSRRWRRHPADQDLHELPLADLDAEPVPRAGARELPRPTSRSSGCGCTTCPTSSTSTTAST